MDLDDATRERIASLIEANPVLLFMKGDRTAPQCGFSAQVIQMLDSLIPDYATCDVLSDPGIRDGIKTYSSWPTIPQLYIKGEFIGGCDIVSELYGSGELAGKLGVEVPAAITPSVTLSDAAAAALRQIAEQRPGQALHLSIDARFGHNLYMGPPGPGVPVEAAGISIHMDPGSASRADGLKIDCVDTDEGPGFHIDNPNAPSPVNQLTVRELKAKLDAGDSFVLLDARTPEEREQAKIEGARLLDPATAREIEGLPKDTTLVIHCHHGGRSQAASEHFAALGFRDVHNVVGGIDAWSQEIDPTVPRY